MSGNLWIFGGGGFGESGLYGALNDLWKFSPSSGNWTWETGSNMAFAPSVYGTQGVAASRNTPGARQGSASWVDASGNLWLMGGYANGVDDWDDLWKFDIKAMLWTWIGGSSSHGEQGVYGTLGIPDPANHPGAREDAMCFTDLQGRFWLFGVADATSNPGARRGAAVWRDNSGNPWLFGGVVSSGSEFYEYGDFWMFNVSSKQWTWLGGSNQPNSLGTYGTQGATSAANTPGSRVNAIGIIGNDGTFWLLGGYAPGDKGPYGFALNDVWRYRP
jgi:hypothetical protein